VLYGVGDGYFVTWFLCWGVFWCGVDLCLTIVVYFSKRGLCVCWLGVGCVWVGVCVCIRGVID